MASKSTSWHPATAEHGQEKKKQKQSHDWDTSLTWYTFVEAAGGAEFPPHLSFRDPTYDLLPTGHQRSHHHWVGHHTGNQQNMDTVLKSYCGSVAVSVLTFVTLKGPIRTLDVGWKVFFFVSLVESMFKWTFKIEIKPKPHNILKDLGLTPNSSIPAPPTWSANQEWYEQNVPVHWKKTNWH